MRIPDFSEAREMLSATKYRPCVSIILPFEPKISLKAELQYKLKLALGRVESELLANYTEDKSLAVLRRLRKVIRTIDYNTHKKSIAIYASPILEKIYYLDIPVEEKIIIDDSFEIRDLVYSKKEMHKYLVLVLTGKKIKIYLGDSTTFVHIIPNIPDHIVAYKNDFPERVSNFSDPGERKEIMLDKFLRHTDDGLTVLLKTYPFPLFVMGTNKVTGHFKKISKNNDRITGIVQGNYEETPEEELRSALKPEIKKWKAVKEKDLLHRLDVAHGAGKLAFGIKNVWKEACEKRGRLLVVEKNYISPAHHSGKNDIIYRDEIAPGNKFYIKDAVDDVIEKVLENGGDVEFVDPGILKDFNRIALLLYY